MNTINMIYLFAKNDSPILIFMTDMVGVVYIQKCFGMLCNAKYV